MRLSLFVVMLAASTMLSACAQEKAAPIVDKGRSEFTRDRAYAVYHKNRSSTRSSGGAAPVSLSPAEPARYESAARVESIGVKDLGAPDNSAKPEQSFVSSHGTVSQAAPTAPAARRAGDRPFQSGESSHAGNRDLDVTRPVQTALNEPARKPTGDLAQKALDDALATPSLTVSQSKAGMIWPVRGRVVSAFGPKGSGVVNDGVNIAAETGTPVRAAASGKVAYAGNKIKGYGNMVLITHAGGRNTTYAHLSKMAVAKNARVKQGDIIGYVGDSGNVKSPQLHFAVREGKTPVNPEQLIQSSVASVR